MAAEGDDETTIKLALFPCFPVGEDDADGELEYESDAQKLKIEVWVLRGSPAKRWMLMPRRPRAKANACKS